MSCSVLTCLANSDYNTKSLLMNLPQKSNTIKYMFATQLGWFLDRMDREEVSCLFPCHGILRERKLVGKLITDNQVCGHKLNLAGHHGLLVSYSWFELMVSLWTDLFPSIITIRFVSPNKLVLGYSTVLCSVINFLSLT